MAYAAYQPWDGHTAGKPRDTGQKVQNADGLRIFENAKSL